MADTTESILEEGMGNYLCRHFRQTVVGEQRANKRTLKAFDRCLDMMAPQIERICPVGLVPAADGRIGLIYGPMVEGENLSVWGTQKSGVIMAFDAWPTDEQIDELAAEATENQRSSLWAAIAELVDRDDAGMLVGLCALMGRERINRIRVAQQKMIGDHMTPLLMVAAYVNKRSKVAGGCAIVMPLPATIDAQAAMLEKGALDA